jgi:hypothetical protein
MDKDTKPTIIYIMGYGRSGSTLLDIILGNNPKIESLGEVAFYYNKYMDQDNLCSCSKSLSNCQFWSQVNMKHAIYVFPLKPWDLYSFICKVENILSLPLLIFNLLPFRTVEGYRKHMQGFFRAVMETSGRKVLIDSSKSTRTKIGRPVAMKKICGFDIKIIHLVRDGRGIMFSRLKGKNQLLEKGMNDDKWAGPYFATISWLITNLTSLLVEFLYFRGKTLRVNYEDIVSNYKQEIQRISRFIGVNLDNVIETIEQNMELKVGHNVGGNRIRLEKKVTLKKDFEWQDKLPYHYQIFFLIFIWPLSKLFRFCNSNSINADKKNTL